MSPVDAVNALIAIVALYFLVTFIGGLPNRDRIIVLVVNAFVAVALLGMQVPRHIFIFALIVVNFVAKARMFHSEEQMLNLLEDQLANALLIISGALKAGRSLEQGFLLVERGMPSPISEEFRTMRTEQELGLTFEESLKNFMKRTPSKDYKLFLTATLFQRETGGNLIALYDQIVFAVSERRRLKGRLDNMTVQGRYTGYIMMVIPLGFLGFMWAVNRQRFFSLMNQPHGTELFFGAFAWLGLGIFWLWNIVNKKHW
jgi:tight adherence protein B